VSARHPRIARTAPRRIGPALALIVSTLAVGTVPGIAAASPAIARASKSKHHAKPVKCKKGFENKHGRCVSSVTPVY
jgi:hypothetical protein